MKNSIRHKTPQSNLTQLLMQAQESKHLVERLVNLKPTIDNKQPKYFQIKPQKKAAVTPLRQREIEQENSHLLKKMLSIIQRKNNTYRDKQRVQAFNQVTSQIQNSQNQISAPDKNDSQEKLQYMDQVKHVNNHNLTQVVNGSLNYYQRKKELENINQNNKQMLKALKNTKPALKREDWTMHSRKHDLLMRHLQGHRHKSPPQTANMLLPVLNNSRVNRLNGDRGNPQSNRYTYKKDNGDLNESQRQYFSNENMNKTQISNSNSYRVIQKQDFPHQTSTNFNKDSKFQMPITPKVDKESSHQSPARNHQEEKEQSRPMTKSVPRGPHRYYDHVLQSPLMHLTNYPMSIVKRITSTRVVASERSTRRKSDSQGWQKSDNIVKMSLIDQPFLNEQTQQIDTHEDNYQNQDLVISSNQPVLRESKQSQRYTPQSIIKEVSRENKHKNDEEHSLVQIMGSHCCLNQKPVEDLRQTQGKGGSTLNLSAQTNNANVFKSRTKEPQYQVSSRLSIGQAAKENTQQILNERHTIKSDLKDVDFAQSGKFTFAPKGTRLTSGNQPDVNFENGGVSFGGGVNYLQAAEQKKSFNEEYRKSTNEAEFADTKAPDVKS